MANENLSERKSLGIVDWFGGYSRQEERELDYGFITVLLNHQNVTLVNAEVRLKRRDILPKSRTPSKNSFVKFRDT